MGERWNTRYAGLESAGQAAAEVLAWNAELLPGQGIGLDLACGLGGNAIALAERGLTTQAWDKSEQAVAAVNRYASSQGLPLQALVRDLETAPPAPQSVDVITVSRYLHRPLCPHLVQALRPGGLLFYQTFSKHKVQGSGPSNPAFLLADGELLDLFGELQLLVYREERDAGDISRGFRDQAMLVGRKRT